MLIVIEGLDGSGKSTVSKILAMKLNANLLTTPGTDLKDTRKQLDTIFKNNPKARQLFYMSTVLNVSDDAQALIASGQHVVVDRYWLSTQVYHCWMTNGQHYLLHEIESELLKPDLTVYLDLPLNERIKRISNRNNCTCEDRQTLTQEADAKLRGLYESMCDDKPVGKWIVIDASQDISVVVDTILNNAMRLSNL